LSIMKPLRNRSRYSREVAYILGLLHYENDNYKKAYKYYHRAYKQTDNPAKLDDLEQRMKRIKGLLSLNLSKTRFRHFDIFVPSDVHLKAASLNHFLKRAYMLVGADLGIRPDRRFSVLIYKPGDFRRVVGAPVWSGGVFDGKIHLKYEKGGNPPYSKRTITHEYTHALAYYMGTDNIPLWLNEGLATYMEHRHHNLDYHYRALKKYPPDKTIRSLHDVSRLFRQKDDSRKIRLAYEYSYSMIDFWQEKYGLLQLRRLLEETGKKASFEDALHEVALLSSQNFRYRWEDWVNHNLMR
ncbi:MAG: peptidase MA family metallohydrolase, partial [bacterium]